MIELEPLSSPSTYRPCEAMLGRPPTCVRFTRIPVAARRRGFAADPELAALTGHRRGATGRVDGSSAIVRRRRGSSA